MPAPLIPIALGVAKTVTGLINKGKSKREADRLKRSRPQYSIDEGYGQNLDLAESEASTGLSATAENAYNQLADKQFSSSLDAILKSGGTATNVAEVYGQGEEGRLRLAQLSDEMRLNKINSVMRAREAMAEQEDKKFMYNVDAPWKDAAQANAEARRGAEDQIWSGLQTVGSAGMQFMDQQSQQKQQNDYLRTSGGGGGNTSTYTPPALPNVVLPSSSPNTGNLQRYQSGWQMTQDNDYITQLLNQPV
jgi:hypothetical protein